MILIVIAIVAAIFYFKIAMTASQSLVVGNMQLAGTIASLLNAVQIQVMNYIYGTVSVYLNEFENHRTETIYEDALIGKTFVFQFVNSFAALFYISFVKPFIPNEDPCSPR
jgi:anoctamin-10/anoctamin-7